MPTAQTKAKTKQGKGKNQTANKKRPPEANPKTVRHHPSSRRQTETDSLYPRKPNVKLTGRGPES